MSATIQRIPLARAQQLMSAVIAELEPSCERIAAAGSVRRKWFQIGDLEIVAIARKGFDLFGDSQPKTAVDKILDDLCIQGRVKRLKDGPRFKQLELTASGVKVDLFLCDEQTWAVNYLIRTGPAAFSHRFVTPKTLGGWLPNNMRIGDGLGITNRLFVDGKLVETLTEESLFEAVGMKFVPPEKRK